MTIADSSIDIPGYTVIRRDRNSHGGGVCAYIINTLQCTTLLPTPTTQSTVECLFLKLSLPAVRSSRSVIVGGVYRPPSSTVDFWGYLADHCDSVLPDATDLIIVGDFNTDTLHPFTTHHFKHLTSFCDDFDLKNIVTRPTRMDRSCLDLVLISSGLSTSSPTVLCLNGVSDHDLVFICLNDDNMIPLPQRVLQIVGRTPLH